MTYGILVTGFAIANNSINISPLPNFFLIPAWLFIFPLPFPSCGSVPSSPSSMPILGHPLTYRAPLSRGFVPHLHPFSSAPPWMFAGVQSTTLPSLHPSLTPLRRCLSLVFKYLFSLFHHHQATLLPFFTTVEPIFMLSPDLFTITKPLFFFPFHHLLSLSSSLLFIATKPLLSSLLHASTLLTGISPSCSRHYLFHHRCLYLCQGPKLPSPSTYPSGSYNH